MKDFGRRPRRGTRPAKELLLLWWLIAAGAVWNGTPQRQGPYSRQGPNCTDFATFNSLSNARVADPLRPNFGLGLLIWGNFGVHCPKMVRGSGENVMGIDSPYGGLLACGIAVGLSLGIGELLGDKFRGPKLGLFCGLSLSYGG